jgi:hypothetical protein
MDESVRDALLDLFLPDWFEATAEDACITALQLRPFQPPLLMWLGGMAQ